MALSEHAVVLYTDCSWAFEQKCVKLLLVVIQSESYKDKNTNDKQHHRYQYLTIHHRGILIIFAV